MAWGKAVPAWYAAALPPHATSSSVPASVRLQAALNLLVHLNDKYALDGGTVLVFNHTSCFGFEVRDSVWIPYIASLRKHLTSSSCMYRLLFLWQ
jgi:hypothetical protein